MPVYLISVDWMFTRSVRISDMFLNNAFKALYNELVFISRQLFLNLNSVTFLVNNSKAASDFLV